jgi:hypothetical protein
MEGLKTIMKASVRLMAIAASTNADGVYKYHHVNKRMLRPGSGQLYPENNVSCTLNMAKHAYVHNPKTQ